MSHADRVPPGGTHLELRRDATEVARARQAVGRFLAGSPTEVLTIAQLLTSELVSNAMEHGSGTIRLGFDCTDDILRVHVFDASSHRPVLRRPALEHHRGRGLLMVESLAMSWGVTPDSSGTGKSVWFALRIR